MLLGLDTEQRLPEESRNFAFKHNKPLANLAFSFPSSSLNFPFVLCVYMSVCICVGDGWTTNL